MTLAIAALLAVSCKKGDDGSDIDKSGYTVFTVDTEQIDFDGASASDSWENGDKLGVFGSQSGSNVPYTLKRSGEGSRTAAFYGPLVTGTSIKAYFPYSESLVTEDGKIPFWLNTTQQFSTDGALNAFIRQCNSTFAVSDESSVLHFLYPLGLLAVQLRVEEVMYVTSMTLESTEGIAGRLLVGDDILAQPSGISSKSISLDFSGEAVASRQGDNITNFYFVLPPAVYPAKSLRLKIVTTEEELSVNLRETAVSRVSATDFNISTVYVWTSDIPGFDIMDGYLE